VIKNEAHGAKTKNSKPQRTVRHLTLKVKQNLAIVILNKPQDNNHYTINLLMKWKPFE
jgi:hypothetical protein